MSATMSTSPSTSSSALTAAELAEWSQSLKPVVLGLSITMLVLGNMGVMLRIWAQWRIQKRPMPEDYLLVMAVVRFHSSLPATRHIRTQLSLLTILLGLLALCQCGLNCHNRRSALWTGIPPLPGRIRRSVGHEVDLPVCVAHSRLQRALDAGHQGCPAPLLPAAVHRAADLAAHLLVDEHGIRGAVGHRLDHHICALVCARQLLLGALRPAVNRAW